MNRHVELRRRSWINAGKPRKKLPAVNVARQAKKAKRYSAALARYHRSETAKVVAARAGGQCERIVDGVRCEYVGRLIHNHLTYARFGGQELPSDVEAICPAHNGEYEGARPWRRRGK